nr:DUF3391 domain-containing protein [Vibrio metschnikovii]
MVLIVASTSIKITVDRLQPGLHIRLPVKWNEHPFLFNSFKALTLKINPMVHIWYITCLLSMKKRIRKSNQMSFRKVI